MTYIPDEQLKNLTPDQLVELYRQGYTVRENVYTPINDVLPYSPRNQFKFMSMDSMGLDLGLGLLGIAIGLIILSPVYYNLGKIETEWLSKRFK